MFVTAMFTAGGFILGIVSGLGLALYLGEKWGKEMRPYRWECPQCPAKFSSNDMKLIDECATEHIAQFHPVTA